MRINEVTEVYVDKIAILDDVMTLGVLVKNTSGKPDSVETKLAVRFEKPSETRIFPLPVRSTSFDEDGNYAGYAMFEYELDNIFFSGELNEFSVVVQIYNGNDYENVLVEDMTFDQVREKSGYVCRLEHNTIVVSRKKQLRPYPHNFLLSFFCGVYRLLEYVMGILLIPLFLLDGIYRIMLGKSRLPYEETFEGGQLKQVILFAVWRYAAFCRCTVNIARLKKGILEIFASLFSVFCRKDHILFVSSRRGDVTGNIAFVNDVLQKKGAKVLFWLEPGRLKELKMSKVFDLALKLAKSKVVVVDDFTPILNDMAILKSRSYVQLWHACGAFKTFGFSRIGKDGGPEQTSSNHRNYDYAMVSSSEIRRFYAEGFGIDEKCVKALGIPRTDVFFDQQYKQQIRQKLYEQYPVLKGKKVLLFAPTFRGNGAGTAHYPFEKFHANELLKQLGEDYVIVIKHHPFVLESHPVQENSRILDLSAESEINDLLFVTDYLITDYSSVIFEASLLDIPMLFYAYDLEEYVVNRDFYYPFKSFVPGKIVRNETDIFQSIEKNDCQQEKIQSFKQRFFDDLDGKSSERVADFILSL